MIYKQKEFPILKISDYSTKRNTEKTAYFTVHQLDAKHSHIISDRLLLRTGLSRTRWNLKIKSSGLISPRTCDINKWRRRCVHYSIVMTECRPMEMDTLHREKLHRLQWNEYVSNSVSRSLVSRMKTEAWFESCVESGLINESQRTISGSVSSMNSV